MTVSFFFLSVYFMNGRVEVSCKITQFLWQLEGTSTQNRRSVATQMSGKVMAGAPFTSHSGLSRRNRCVCVCLCHTETGVSMFLSYRNRCVNVCLYHTETGMFVFVFITQKQVCLCLCPTETGVSVCLCPTETGVSVFVSCLPLQHCCYL